MKKIIAQIQRLNDENNEIKAEKFDLELKDQAVKNQ